METTSSQLTGDLMGLFLCKSDWLTAGASPGFFAKQRFILCKFKDILASQTFQTSCVNWQLVLAIPCEPSYRRSGDKKKMHEWTYFSSSLSDWSVPAYLKSFSKRVRLTQFNFGSGIGWHVIGNRRNNDGRHRSGATVGFHWK